MPGALASASLQQEPPTPPAHEWVDIGLAPSLSLFLGCLCLQRHCLPHTHGPKKTPPVFSCICCFWAQLFLHSSAACLWGPGLPEVCASHVNGSPPCTRRQSLEHSPPPWPCVVLHFLPQDLDRVTLADVICLALQAGAFWCAWQPCWPPQRWSGGACSSSEKGTSWPLQLRLL